MKLKIGDLVLGQDGCLGMIEECLLENNRYRIRWFENQRSDFPYCQEDTKKLRYFYLDFRGRLK